MNSGAEHARPFVIASEYKTQKNERGNLLRILSAQGGNT